MQRYLPPVLRVVVGGLAFLLIAGGLGVSGAYQYLEPAVPDIAALRDVRLQVPLRIYTRDGRLIAQIGEQRRIPLPYSSYPKTVIDAFLSAEDDRFFEHQGVDYPGLVRAVMVNLRSGEKREGGGTITMQLARNIFLSPERSYRRKLLEIFSALKIERAFTKQEILSLYLNKIFLGQRAYGVAAAAEVYFGKTVDQLNLSEIALIAGLPRAPSRDNPVTSAELARHRRAYVLRRMLEVKAIDQPAYQAALQVPIESRLHGPAVELEAPYIAEMVRSKLLEQYGPDIYTNGYEAITTIDSRLQRAAVGALRLSLFEYDQRHGYRGPAGHVDLKTDATETEWNQALEDYSNHGGLVPAIVIGLEDKGATAYTARYGRASLGWNGLEWARPPTADGGVGKAPQSATDILKAGDIIYLARDNEQHWRLMQVPEAEGAFVALDPQDGAVVALSGGFDYFSSSFNRAVQAKRQPGSSFKPFLYSSALENGFTAATLVNDAPIVFEDASLEGSWRPQNDSRKFYGPTRLREALVRSRNLVSLRIMHTLGPPYVIDYAQRFGFDPKSLPPNLTLALGTAQLSPLEMARGYAVFANGGFRVDPYFIAQVRTGQDGKGQDKTLFAATPVFACATCAVPDAATTSESPSATVRTEKSQSAALMADAASTAMNPLTAVPTPMGANTTPWAPRAISAQNAYIMTDMMADVIKRGTATRALALNRPDIAGKTGTTNDRRDTWFCGFNADIVAAAWIGFDQERSLGPREEGGRTALPMWMYFMEQALKGLPPHRQPAPPGLVTMRISPATGLPASAGDTDAIFETFMPGHVPQSEASDSENGSSLETPSTEKKDESLF